MADTPDPGTETPQTSRIRRVLLAIVEQDKLYAMVEKHGVAGPWRPMRPDDRWPGGPDGVEFEVHEPWAEVWVRPWVVRPPAHDSPACAAYVYLDKAYDDWHFWCYEDADGGAPERASAQRWCDLKATYFTVDGATWEP